MSTYALGFTTLGSETSRHALRLQGALPSWLGGMLVRTGPARFEVGRTKYNHWFDGLAMLHSFAFAAGRVTYTNRFLRSQAYEEAMKAGTIRRSEFATDPCRGLFGRVASWFSPKLSDNGCVNVAQLARAVVALTETRLPVRFEPDTLTTLGVAEYDRKIQGPVSTAHPHFDRTRRIHYSYTLDFGRRSVYRFFAIDAETGQQSVVSTLSVERPAYVHSFGMSERYLVLVECPLVVNPLRLRFRGQPFIRNYEWQPERGVRFHVVEKANGKVVRRARAEAFFAFHHVNAFEDGDDVVVDLVSHPDASVIDQLYLDRLRSAERVRATGRLTRFRIGPRVDTTGEWLADVPIELPRFDYGRRAGRRHQIVYGVSNEITGDFLDSLVKVDLDRGTAVRWSEEGCYPGEPVFVDAPNGVAEDDGVVISLVLDAPAGRSFLLVLDASTFREVARAETPHPVPFGFHGNYLAPPHEARAAGGEVHGHDS